MAEIHYCWDNLVQPDILALDSTPVLVLTGLQPMKFLIKGSTGKDLGTVQEVEL